jgi:hypothetical protein
VWFNCGIVIFNQKKNRFMKKIRNISTILVAVASIVIFYGCKKSYLDTVPSDAVTDANLYTTTTSSYQVLDGLERLMNTTGASYEPLGGGSRANDWGESTVRFEEDHLGNDMVDVTNGFDWFIVCYNYTGLRQPTYNVAQMPFRLYYKMINSANLLLDHVNPTVTSGPQTEIDHIRGQAYAYRAYSYFKLSVYYCKTYNYYADGKAPGHTLDEAAKGLPIYLHGTTADTKGVGRSTMRELYAQIASDLDSAGALLNSSGLSARSTSDISLPVYYAICAKVAMVKRDWKAASDYADQSINSFGGRIMSPAEFKQGFNSNTNPEWMWSSTLTSSQTQALLIVNFFSFVDPASPGYASTGLITTMAANTYNIMRTINDVRKDVFLSGGAQQSKFRLADPKAWAYNNLYMRLSEVYLMKAEALAEQGDEANAIIALNKVVQQRNITYDYNTAGSRYITALGNGTVYFGRTTLLQEIYLQRRIELFLEGVAYSDIQRWRSGLNRAKGVGNHPAAAGVWAIPAEDDRFLFKIPQQEMDANPALAGQQN